MSHTSESTRVHFYNFIILKLTTRRSPTRNLFFYCAYLWLGSPFCTTGVCNATRGLAFANGVGGCCGDDVVSASIALLGGVLIPYELDEDADWGLCEGAVRAALDKARKDLVQLLAARWHGTLTFLAWPLPLPFSLSLSLSLSISAFFNSASSASSASTASYFC